MAGQRHDTPVQPSSDAIRSVVGRRSRTFSQRGQADRLRPTRARMPASNDETTARSRPGPAARFEKLLEDRARIVLHLHVEERRPRQGRENVGKRRNAELREPFRAEVADTTAPALLAPQGRVVDDDGHAV